ncbi:MAG: hypothetical protein ACOC1K_02925 [Nanoarchaeota archaeon]
MIEKINLLKTNSNSKEVKILCENTLNTINSVTYNNVTPRAKHEIERVTYENLFENLSNISDEEVQGWLKREKRLYTINNLGVRESIEKLSNEKNSGLEKILEQFENLLDNGYHEALLYEEFTSALQSFSYFPTVGNAIKAVQDRVQNYKSDVDITKILETMKTTKSGYLVPLIEDVVNNYIANKNETTKHQLKETLIKFTYDPFVRDIVNLVSLDATELQLEYANGECDIEKIYSPVMYIGEGEAVFNVKGAYYIRKGNNVNRIPSEEYSKLDESYKALCQLINEEDVIIEKKNITLYGKKNSKAIITGDEVIINETSYNNEQIRNAAENSEWSGDTEFLIKAAVLMENFDNIAEVDFVKRVYLKENLDFSADVFKLRDNIFITTHDPELGKGTFYRNINPIQAKNIMMEHLRFDVSKTFKYLLPDEEKILSQINETKESYNSYINELDEKINTFSNMTLNKVNKTVLEALKDELEEEKEEYKDYLHRAEAYTRIPEELNENITIEVNGKKYVIPEDAGNGEVSLTDDDEDSGTEVGSEDIEDKPADAITFDDDETELLGDSPSIEDDEIDLGGDEAIADADAEEAEFDLEDEDDKEDQEEEAEDNKEEEDADTDEEEGEEGEEDFDLGLSDDEDEDEDEDKNESAEGAGLTKKKFTESGENSKKKKVYLKKKKKTNE